MPHRETAAPAIEEPSRQIDYVGSATSHFQAEPLLYDGAGRLQVFTDWEHELSRLVQGQPCGIPEADTTALPQFPKDTYISRSAELSENMIRLSLDFGRLCPEEGEFNEPLMKEYVKTLALIRRRGQEPFVTLQHFTMPKYLVETDHLGTIKTGAWEHRQATQHFRYYVANVVRSMADPGAIRRLLVELNLSLDSQEKILSEGLVRYFMPINEPTVLLFNSYLGRGSPLPAGPPADGPPPAPKTG